MIIGFVLLGVVAGISSGMFGIGGGVVIVPALTGLFGFTLQGAVGTSLAAMLLPVGIFGALAYYRAGKLRLLVSMLVAIGLIIGGYFGAQLALSLPTAQLRQLYGLFLLYAAWRFAEPIRWWQAWRGMRVAVSGETLPETKTQPVLLLLVGLGAGVISGMFGVGGGIVIVPALIALLNFDQKLAVGTSLGALLLPVGLGGVISYYDAGVLDVIAAAGIAAGLVLGAFIGAKIALGLPAATVKRLYGLFLLFVGLRFLLGG